MWIEGGPETRTGAAVKATLAVGLIVLTEVAIFDLPPGWGIGVFCLAWTAALAVAAPGVWRHRGALLALCAAAVLGAIEFDRPSFIGLILFWLALTTAALLPMTGAFEDVFRWAQRLFLHGFVSLFGPLIDLWTAQRRLPPGVVRRTAARSPIVILPIVGGVVFLTLFAAANPVLAELLSRIHWPQIDEAFVLRTIFAGLVLVLVWGVLRPRPAAPFLGPVSKAPIRLSVATLALSLVVFNALFALQNGLDLAFLWSGAALPAGVTFADYAHRGAYTLIFTALLAGAFVLVVLHPGTPGANSRWVRVLVVLWTLQNLMLVASSALRTTDYVQAYGLTRLRLAALVWMGLVAVGLALICWRMLRGRSGGWLMNANALAAGLVLAASSLVDYGAVAAHWNVRHPQQPSGAVDLCYLRTLGPQALVSLVELEQTPLDPVTRDAVATLRGDIVQTMETQQADPYGWSWRAARRLARAQVVNGDRPFAAPLLKRNCALTAYPQPKPVSSEEDPSNAFRR